MSTVEENAALREAEARAVAEQAAQEWRDTPRWNADQQELLETLDWLKTEHANLDDAIERHRENVTEAFLAGEDLKIPAKVMADRFGFSRPTVYAAWNERKPHPKPRLARGGRWTR